MNTSLGGKSKVQQEYANYAAECKGWFVGKERCSVADKTAGDNLQVSKQGGDADKNNEEEEKTSPQPASGDTRKGCFNDRDGGKPPLSWVEK